MIIVTIKEINAQLKLTCFKPNSARLRQMAEFDLHFNILWGSLVQCSNVFSVSKLINHASKLDNWNCGRGNTGLRDCNLAKMLHAYASSDIKYKNRNNCTEMLQTTRAYNSNTNTRTHKTTQTKFPTDFPTYLQKLITDSVGRSKIQNKEK